MSKLVRAIKDLYWLAISDHSQTRCIIKFINNTGADSTTHILDVACGYGRNLRALKSAGYDPIGVDINPEIVKAVNNSGFKCYQPNDTAVMEKKWDVILMSHIIEHFDYKSLFDMMNSYLNILKPGGILVIATPLLNSRFYDNFDHVKPYTPVAIENVFGKKGLQVQFQSDHELILDDLWIRRRPYLLQLFPSLFKSKMSVGKIFLGSINIFLVLIHLLSFRLIGVRDGWAGIYRLK